MLDALRVRIASETIGSPVSIKNQLSWILTAFSVLLGLTGSLYKSISIREKHFASIELWDLDRGQLYGQSQKPCLTMLKHITRYQLVPGFPVKRKMTTPEIQYLVKVRHARVASVSAGWDR